MGEDPLFFLETEQRAGIATFDFGSLEADSFNALVVELPSVVLLVGWKRGYHLFTRIGEGVGGGKRGFKGTHHITISTKFTLWCMHTCFNNFPLKNTSCSFTSSFLTAIFLSFLNNTRIHFTLRVFTWYFRNGKVSPLLLSENGAFSFAMQIKDSLLFVSLCFTFPHNFSSIRHTHFLSPFPPLHFVWNVDALIGSFLTGVAKKIDQVSALLTARSSESTKVTVAISFIFKLNPFLVSLVLAWFIDPFH